MKRIRTGFRISLLVGICLIGSAILAYTVSQSMLVVDSAQSKALDTIADEGMELVHLTHAVLQYPGPRTIEQWRSQFEELNALFVASSKTVKPNAAAVIERARIRLRVMGTLQEKLLQARDKGSAGKQSPEIAVVLSAQLFQEATQLQSALRAVRSVSNASLEHAYEQARIRQIGIFVLFAILGTLFGFIVSVGFRRRILNPLGDLERTIHVVREGGQQRAPILADDEIGALCAAFNNLLDEEAAAEAEIVRLNQELEQRVAVRTTQLEAANKELEAFSYSVSHDLRTPLRAIDGYAQILLEDYPDALDEAGKSMLEKVRNNTVRMGQLIDDILDFSRMGRTEMALAPVDLAAMAREVFAEIMVSNAGRDVRLRIGDVPPAVGDSAMLRQVLVNLLANAVKYTRPRDEAVIVFVGKVEADENVYFVKDNGVGFEMQYAGKLFGVFQRLHRQTEFEGTGIGLAIVKRIVGRHGGRVWATSKLGDGASFHFTLPRRDPEKHG